MPRKYKPLLLVWISFFLKRIRWDHLISIKNARSLLNTIYKICALLPRACTIDCIVLLIELEDVISSIRNMPLKDLQVDPATELFRVRPGVLQTLYRLATKASVSLVVEQLSGYRITAKLKNYHNSQHLDTTIQALEKDKRQKLTQIRC